MLLNYMLLYEDRVLIFIHKLFYLKSVIVYDEQL